MSVCTSFWFWFIVFACFAVLLWSAFNWGWGLGARNKDLQWEQKVKSLHQKWEREVMRGPGHKQVILSEKGGRDRQ